MDKKQLKRNLVLGILFFLPVVFLLFLYPASHNYNTLDVVKNNVSDLETPVFKDHLTILAFYGTNPEQKLTPALNLKELIYDKFQGFKKFQVIVLVPFEAKASAERLRLELSKYKVLKYWTFVFETPENINSVYNSLNTSKALDFNLATNDVFIIDKEVNQRGRLDDRLQPEKDKNKPVYSLPSYDASSVAVLKNKMSDDLRILFTEIREKRKGNFDSTSRRKDDLNKIKE